MRQYRNAGSTILKLAEYFRQYFDVSGWIDQFYELIWDVSTATGHGLDIWGRIVDISRYVQVNIENDWFGYITPTDELTKDFTPFNDAPFFVPKGKQDSYQYRMDDEPYRLMIMAKAARNIGITSAYDINRILREIFFGRGDVFVLDGLDMTMTYYFMFDMHDWEMALMQSSEILPRPSGVQPKFVFIPVSNTFGFDEAESGYAPLDNGMFSWS